MYTTDNIEKDKDKIWYKKHRVQIACVLMTATALSVIITVKNNQNNLNAEQSIQQYIQAAAVQKQGNTGADGDIEVVSGAKNNMDNMVTIYLEKTGRSDPFLPPADYEQIYSINDMLYYMSPPPEGAGYDTDAVEVVKTKVSGIMYDNYNPVAILNIDGSDYLVKSGETINNYKILSISPSSVTVQLGANTFKAGVGQLFSEEDIHYVNDSFGSSRRRNF